MRSNVLFLEGNDDGGVLSKTPKTWNLPSKERRAATRRSEDEDILKGLKGCSPPQKLNEGRRRNRAESRSTILSRSMGG